MIKNSLKFLLTALFLFIGIVTYAHDLSVVVSGQKLYFNITDKEKKNVELTYKGSIVDKALLDVKGFLEIPTKIKYDDEVYNVISIGQKAFLNATGLEGVLIPTGVVKIGDFAFEGCKNLKNIVFPTNNVQFGQGVFFKCSKIENITIGSDWKNIDFTMFRWTEKMEMINIPARIEKIQGLKKIKSLKKVIVDANNQKFSSFEGLLYSKDYNTLYVCPRSFEGKVYVKEGVKDVLKGSLIDCLQVTEIDFPSTLESISFRETMRMQKLETIVIRATEPMITAYKGGKGYFLFQTASSKLKILMPHSAKDKYLSILPPEPGEFSTSSDGIPFVLGEKNMITKKNLKFVKSF